MPSLENWEWGLKIFDGAPTLMTHVNHLLCTQHAHTQIQSLYIYLRIIVHQTTHLREARVNAKVVHAAVVSISHPPPPGEVVMLKVICNINEPPFLQGHVLLLMEWISLPNMGPYIYLHYIYSCSSAV